MEQLVAVDIVVQLVAEGLVTLASVQAEGLVVWAAGFETEYVWTVGMLVVEAAT